MPLILPTGEAPPPSEEKPENKLLRFTVPSWGQFAQFLGLPISQISSPATPEFDPATNIFHPPHNLILLAATARATFIMDNLIISDIQKLTEIITRQQREIDSLKNQLSVDSQTIN